MTQTIETVQTFTADHALLVLDMIMQGYTVGVQTAAKGNKPESTTFWSNSHHRDYVLIGTRFFMSNYEVNPDCIFPQTTKRIFNRFGNKI